MRRALLLIALLLAPGVRAQDQAPSSFLLRVAIAPQGPVWVGQRVTVTVTAMTPVRFVDPPSWPDLAPTEGRAILLPETNTVPGTERVNGESYAALQRSYTIFPATTGALVLAPIRMTARVGGDDGRPVEAMAATPESRIEARLPPGVTDVARFVVATNFRLQAGTEGDASQVRVGDAVVRTLRMEADDATSMLLPPAVWGTPEGVRIYPDPPVLQDRTDRGMLHAERIDRAAFVPQRAGAIELPGFGLTWLDPRSGRMQQVTVPPLRIQAVAAGEAAAATASGWDWTFAVPIGVLVAVGLLWWLARRRHRHAGPAPLAVLARACRAGDAHAALAALYHWCDVVLPPGQERTIATLARLTGATALAREAAMLEALLYRGGASSRWDGTALLHAARQAERALRHRAPRHAAAALPPLNASPAPTLPPRLTQPGWAR